MLANWGIKPRACCEPRNLTAPLLHSGSTGPVVRTPTTMLATRGGLSRIIAKESAQLARRPRCTPQSDTSHAQKQTRCGLRHGITLVLWQLPKLQTCTSTCPRHGLLQLRHQLWTHHSERVVRPRIGTVEQQSPSTLHVRDRRDPLQQDCVLLDCALQMAADKLFMSEWCPEDCDAMF